MKVAELRKEQDINKPSSGRAFLSWNTKITLPASKAQVIFWSVSMLGLAFDLWSKNAVFNWLQQQQSHSVSIINGFLRFVMVENAGAAFGIAAGQRYFLIVVSVLALVGIFALFVFSSTKQNLVYVAMGLLTAGICGNLWDRFFNNGSVRDFIDVYYRQYHWPAFNVADSMLCIGVGLMLISSFFIEKSPRKCARQHK